MVITNNNKYLIKFLWLPVRIICIDMPYLFASSAIYLTACQLSSSHTPTTPFILVHSLSLLLTTNAYVRHKEPQICSRVRPNEYKSKQELQELYFFVLSMKFLISFEVSNAFLQRMKPFSRYMYVCSIRIRLIRSMTQCLFYLKDSWCAFYFAIATAAN